MLRIDRYLVREIGVTLLATMVVLLLMVLSHRLAGFLSKAANGLLARDFIFPLLGLQAISLTSAILPLAFLLSIVITLGRLHHDQEMTALTACGYGPLSVSRAVLILAIPLALISGLLSFVIVPKVMEAHFEVLAQARKHAEVSLWTPGTFREIRGGEHVIHIGVVEDDQLQQVFVQSRHADGAISITLASRGYLEVTEAGVRQLVLEHGHRYQRLLDPDDGHDRLQFERATLRLSTVPPDTTPRRETLQNRTLWDSKDPTYRAEWHFRLNSPMQILLIALWAPPWSRLTPREGRYGRVIAAILLYAIDFNLVAIGESWLMHDRIDPAMGLWWVHALLLGVGLLGLWHQSGRRFWARRCSVPRAHDSLVSNRLD